MRKTDVSLCIRTIAFMQIVNTEVADVYYIKYKAQTRNERTRMYKPV